MKAMDNLSETVDDEPLSPTVLLALSDAKLQNAIRSSGLAVQKTQTLKRLALLFAENRSPTRDELLGVNGVGPETADAIMCFHLNQPAFVADASARRVLGRLWGQHNHSYSSLKSEVEAEAPRDPEFMRRLHGGIVEHAKAFCRKHEARCDECPLVDTCDSTTSILHLPTLTSSRFLSRPNRFVVEVELDSSEKMQAHCPNPGRLLEFFGYKQRPKIWLEPIDNPKAKYRSRLLLAERDGTLNMLNTILAHRIIKPALQQGWFKSLSKFTSVKAEFALESGSRIDFMCETNKGERVLVEVKSSTLVQDRVAYWPDAPSARAVKHMNELREHLNRGYRAAVLFVVQNDNADSVTPNDKIDPRFGAAVRQARDCGVETIAVTTRTHLNKTPNGLVRCRYGLLRSIPVKLDRSLGFDKEDFDRQMG